MCILAIGDIHGCTIAFDTLLAAVQLQPDDQLITLGDYVDHGLDSKGIINRLITLHETGQLVALRGNHEIAMLGARNSDKQEMIWICCDGDKTLASYSLANDELHMANIPYTHWNFLQNLCVNLYETDTHFFVHANFVQSKKRSLLVGVKHQDKLRNSLNNLRKIYKSIVVILGLQPQARNPSGQILARLYYH